jgi:hypothetical protein
MAKVHDIAAYIIGKLRPIDAMKSSPASLPLGKVMLILL